MNANGVIQFFTTSQVSSQTHPVCTVSSLAGFLLEISI